MALSIDGFFLSFAKVKYACIRFLQMIVIFPESSQTFTGVEVKINYSYAETLLFVSLKGCSQQVEVKPGKTKENGTSHLQENGPQLSDQHSSI